MLNNNNNNNFEYTIGLYVPKNFIGHTDNNGRWRMVSVAYNEINSFPI